MSPLALSTALLAWRNCSITVRQAARAVRSLTALRKADLWLQARGPMAGVAAYARLRR